MKATIEEIRTRFDHDVERFSNLETGQTAAPDSALCLDLVSEAAALLRPLGSELLDIGCGAGNYSLKLLEKLPGLNVTLLDVSKPMLERATVRLTDAGAGALTTIQQDVRDAQLDAQRYDVIVAAACLHHLREAREWEAVFQKIHDALRPGGCFFIVDIVQQAHPAVDAATWKRYGKYLEQLGGPDYRDKVLAYIEREDTPRPLVWQLQLLQRVGFVDIDVLHKRLNIAAFGGRRMR